MNWPLRLMCLLSAAMLVAATDPPEGDERIRPASWTTPTQPFRIAGNIYYVGTRGLGAYLIGTPEQAILIDGTLEQNANLVERNIEALGFRMRSVKILLMDQAHYDHVGALAKIKRDSGATFYASEGDRRSLEQGRPTQSGSYPTVDFPPIKVDHVIADGDHITLGDTELTALLTPGHTPGCTSYTTEVRDGDRTLKVLFLCSITVAGNRLAGDHATYPGIVDDYRDTFKRLDHVDADIVLTSHPEVADVMGRERDARAGHEDAFIDRHLLPHIVMRAENSFRQRLGAAKADARRHDRGDRDHDRN